MTSVQYDSESDPVLFLVTSSARKQLTPCGYLT